MKSSQGHVPPWEYTKDFSAIIEPVLSRLSLDGVFTDRLNLQVKKVFSRVSLSPFFAFEISGSHMRHSG